MTKTICLLCLMAVLYTARGQSPETIKIAAAETKVTDANAAAREAKAELKQAYPAFRADMKKRVQDNNIKIKALRATLVRPYRSPQNDSTNRKIAELKDRNYEHHSVLYGSPK